MTAHRTGCASLRHHGAGNSRSLENSRRSHRRDSAWQAHVHGTRVLPMEEPSWLERLLGRR
jgi:hypothetical protein